MKRTKPREIRDTPYHGMTQQALARIVAIHVVHLRRHESGVSQTTLDVIRHLAAALSVSADTLLFEKASAARTPNSTFSSVPSGSSIRKTRKQPCQDVIFPFPS